MLLGSLWASLLGILYTGKGALAKGQERKTIRVGKWTIRAGENF